MSRDEDVPEVERSRTAPIPISYLDSPIRILGSTARTLDGLPTAAHVSVEDARHPGQAGAGLTAQQRETLADPYVRERFERQAVACGVGAALRSLQHQVDRRCAGSGAALRVRPPRLRAARPRASRGHRGRRTSRATALASPAEGDDPPPLICARAGSEPAIAIDRRRAA